MRRFTWRTLMLVGFLAFASAEAAADPIAGPVVPPPPEVAQLLQLMQSPAVRSWLDAQSNTPAAIPPLAAADESFSTWLGERIAHVRAHLGALFAEAPLLSDELSRAATRLGEEFKTAGAVTTALSLALVVVSGLALEGLYLLAIGSTRGHAAGSVESGPGGLPRKAWLPAVHHLSRFVVFAAGALAGLLAFEHLPLVRRTAVALLLATVTVRLGVLLAALVFPPPAPGAGEAGRAQAMDFRRRRLGVAIGVSAFGWAFLDLLQALGSSLPAREVMADVLALAVVAVALEASWRRPRLATGPAGGPRAGQVALWAFTVYLCALWLLFAAGLHAFFWPTLLAYLLPKSMAIFGRALRQWLGAESANDAPGATSFSVVYAERFLRVLLVVGAALLLAYAWKLDVTALSSGDALRDRLIRGILSSVVILFAADLVWHITKTFIDRTVKISHARTGLEAEEAARHARLRTLLPILRNLMFIVIAMIAVLMALSSLGLAIAPLIAGAGVVGVAIGFGSQTIVKDIISGVFYLLDDAYRVGEYIECGAYTGTVESFSLRSIRLRHPRGGVFTVPFGELGAIKNLQRDWAIDKFLVNVSYDTDFAKAKRLVKKVAAELLLDPDVGPCFMEPLKLQGIQELGAYSVALRLKMTVRPGEQTTVRRRVLAAIKVAFDENGIEFPFPTVHVEGAEKDPALAAAAQEALRLVQTSAA